MIHFLSEEDKIDGFLNRLDKPSFHHPFHKKNSIVYNQGLCIKRLCSSPLPFQKYLKKLKTWLCNRGYTHKVVHAQVKRVWHSTNLKLMALTFCQYKCSQILVKFLKFIKKHLRYNHQIRLIPTKKTQKFNN